jgi:hypothetical protein
VRHEAAHQDHFQQMRRDRRDRVGRARRQIAHLPRRKVELQPVACRDLVGLAEEERRQAQVERVAIEDAREALRQHRADAEDLQRLRGLFAARSHSEVLAADHDVARLDLGGELGIDRLEAVLRHLFDRQLHVDSRRQDIGVDVVAEGPGAAGHVAAHAASVR